MRLCEHCSSVLLLIMMRAKRVWSLKLVLRGKAKQNIHMRLRTAVVLTVAKWQLYLFYLTTQIRFLIGEERVTCHWLKLSNALRRTKLSDALGQQYLELSTCTWSGRATWNRGKFVCQSAIEVGQRFSLETSILQQENWLIIRQRHIRITQEKFLHSMSSNF